MRALLGLFMISNGALFLFGAIQHAGVAIRPFHEPRIIPATIVEALCGFSLVWGTVAVLRHSNDLWRVALITNLVALGGVLLGMAALAVGAGPRTSTNDLYHRVMLVLIVGSLLILFFARSVRKSKPE